MDGVFFFERELFDRVYPVDWVEFIVPSAPWWLYETSILKTWGELFVVPPLEAHDRR